MMRLTRLEITTARIIKSKLKLKAMARTMPRRRVLRFKTSAIATLEAARFFCRALMNMDCKETKKKEKAIRARPFLMISG